MKPTRLVSLFIVIATAALAQNVPQQVALTARLSNAGAPLSGSHTLVLRLYENATGGTEVWNESTLATAEAGVVSLTLGSQSPLNPSILDGRALFLEVSVDGQALAPRLPVVSVPYAVRASLAASAATLGNLGPADVARANHDHAGAYLPVGASLACSGTDKVSAVLPNGSVVCSTDTGASYSAGTGLTLTGSTFSASFAGSGAASTVARSDHAHAGVYLPLGATLTCTGTQKVTGLSTTGAVVCGADLDTSPGAGAGLTLSGANYAVSFAGSGTATTVARSDHGHGYTCPAGYLSHWWPGGTPEGTKVLCTRAVAGAMTWPAAARACATSYGAGRLCTMQELTIARSPTVPSHTQEQLFSGYWLADRLADDLAMVTNATSGDNFDAQQDPLTTATGFYCCTSGNFFR